MTADAAPTRAPLLGEPLPIELMNTVWADRRGVYDALLTEADVLAWLRAVGGRLEELAPSAAEWLRASQPAELSRTATELRRLRDALRQLAAQTTGDPRAAAASPMAGHAAAAHVLNQALALSPSWPVLDWPPGTEPSRTMGFAGSAGLAIVSLVASEFASIVTGATGPRLRACLAPGCVLYFAKDHNRREWCSPACGNRARAARHYRRSKTNQMS